jgi:hypothetical protein
MPLLCPVDRLDGRNEIVICDSETAKSAHMELFHFSEDAYITANNKSSSAFDMISGIVDRCNSGSGECPAKVHLVVNWCNLLQISAWKSLKPSIGDVFTILKSAGASAGDLQPFKNADVNDIFPSFYYGKKFNILRRLCHKAKKQVEEHLKTNSIRIDCHLVAEDTARIVASSL